ncbi:MAG: hypothetical protein WDZ72_00185, partial [Cyclobacteriaceae bacterium]
MKSSMTQATHKGVINNHLPVDRQVRDSICPLKKNYKQMKEKTDLYMIRGYLSALFIFLMFAACTSLQQKAQNQFSAGEYQMAISSFSQVLEKEPDNPE